MSEEKRSPLRTTPPLRNPGQSANEQLKDVLGEKLLFYVLLLALCIGFGANEWVRYLLRPEPSLASLIALTILMLVVAAWSLGRLKKRRDEAQNWRLGRNGEMVVGQLLEELRADGYEVVHDIPGPEWNIDHVIVGPAGVFAIETKTRNKSKSDRVSYDGKRLKIGDNVSDQRPIEQAEGGARWIAEQIESSTGTWQAVRPVVVFPGWYVNPAREMRFSQRLWVLNQKELRIALERQRRCLDESEIKTIAHALKCHVRSHRKAA